VSFVSSWCIKKDATNRIQGNQNGRTEARPYRLNAEMLSAVLQQTFQTEDCCQSCRRKRRAVNLAAEKGVLSILPPKGEGMLRPN
jgi:hypothetical protein